MRFQGSGFSVELPDGVHDASVYTFAYPKAGAHPPSIIVRFEPADEIDLAERMAEVHASLLENYPQPSLDTSGETLRRGEWQYFTHVLEFGGDELRLTQKEVYILVPAPDRTLYVLSGIDRSDNFKSFEPIYDNFVRTFQPNEIQRL